MSIGIGSRIKNNRKNKGLTQEELGKLVNRSAQVISNWEREYSDPDHEDIALLSEALDCSSDFLLGRFEIIKEGKSQYLDRISADDQLKELLSDPNMLVAFSDYKNWSEEDKKELVAYLRAKKLSREINKSTK